MGELIAKGNTSERLSKKSKEATPKIPSGANILRKSVSTEVEEIENGFITTKNWDVKYEVKDDSGETRTDYCYFQKKYYTKEDPLVLKVASKDKSLADFFNE